MKITINLKDGICYQVNGFDCPFKYFQGDNFESQTTWCNKYDVEIKTEGTLFHQSCKQCIKENRE